MSVYFDYMDVATLDGGIKLYGSACLPFFKESGFIAADVLQEVCSAAVEGVTTKELDYYAESLILKAGASPAFKGYCGYPFATCLSVNEHIVHGLPDNRKLKKGDVISIDLGVRLNGMCADNARTLVVGGGKSEHDLLIKTAEEAFYKGMEKATVGFTIGDISHAIHKEVLKEKSINKKGKKIPKFKVFFNFQGHGIGEELHEQPDVPNMGFKGKGPKILPGMCLCLEPVIMYRNSEVEESVFECDGEEIAQFTTSDCKPSSHFEKQIYVTFDKPIIITQI